jgi:hypothetical protein
MRVETKGFRNTLSALKDLDPEVNKDVTKTLRQSANRLRSEAQDLVDNTGLSGWKGWRGGYDADGIRSGIKVTTAKRRKRGTAVGNVIGVQNTTAAGVIWELAGRKSDGASPRPGINPKTGWTYGNGVGFVAAIRRKSGKRASRTVWGAHDSPQDWSVESERETLIAAVDKACKATQAKLEGLGG